MAKLTKLEIVQRILGAIDSDEVNSISDTVESEQVALLVDAAYDLIIAEQPWPHLRDFRNLEITTTSHLMKIPSGIATIDTLRYNKKHIAYLDPLNMKELLDGRDITLSNVDTNGALNDQEPTYWSSFDDEYIVFDSYDTSLVASYTQVDCYKIPPPMTSDTEYPDLPERFHQLVVFQAMADSFYTLKGDTAAYNIYRKRFKLGIINMQRWARIVNKQRSTGANTNYGRRHLS